ncbi:hypothetical protein HYQ40_07040 [Aerococcaceae bacterium DSM 111021]|nr:hypothetical protein [Aerococcaceae bacterium DSM 111021]
MRNAKVTINFSGHIELELENTAGLVNDEIKDRAMEILATDLDLLTEASEFSFQIDRY